MKNFRLLAILLAVLTVGLQSAMAAGNQSVIDRSPWQALCFKTVNGQAAPPDDWYAVDFDCATWDVITGPLTDDFPQDGTFWCRQGLLLTEEQITQGDLYLRAAHDDAMQIYVNGALVVDCNGAHPDHTQWISSSYFHPGFNLIAVRCVDYGGDSYLDFRFGTSNAPESVLPTCLPVDKPTLYLGPTTITLYDIEQEDSRSLRLNAIAITPEGVSDAPITWTSSNDAVATVSDGLVAAVSAGKTTITASAVVDGEELHASCEVTVVGFPADQKVVFLSEAGTLGNYLTQQEREDLTKLSVIGPINGTDVRILREMAGRDYNENPTGYSLEELDLSNASFVSGGESYHKYGYGTENNKLTGFMFAGCSALKKIAIPANITEIGNTAFCNCSRLKKVIFPEESRLTLIDGDAFSGTAIEEINLPKSLIHILNGAFNGCAKLKSVTIPASVKTIAEYGFSGAGLTSVTFEEGSQLESIGGMAFQDMALESITLPESCTSIGWGAFRFNRQLKSITLSPNQKALNDQVFVECDALTSITFPAKLRIVGNNVFEGCANLNTIIFPEGTEIREIGEKAFGNCRRLEHIFVMTSAAPACAGNAFEDVNATLYVPAEALDEYKSHEVWQQFDVSTFDGNPVVSFSTEEIPLALGAINEGADQYQLEADVFNPFGLLKGEETWTSANPEIATVSRTGLVKAVGNGTTNIGYSVAYGENTYTADCQIKVVTVEDHVSAICVKQPGTLADQLTDTQKSELAELTVYGNVNADDIWYLGDIVRNYGELTSLSLAQANSVDGLIKHGTFTDSKSLQTLTLPSNIRIIEHQSFRNSGIEEIVIPDSVTYIGNYAFGETSMKSVTFNDRADCDDEKNVFDWDPSERISTVNVHVSDIEKDVRMLERFDGRTTVNYYMNGELLTNVVIPDGTTRIGKRKFYLGKGIESLTIPASVKQIGDRALEGVMVVHLLGMTPAALTSAEGLSTDAIYIVPSEALAAYRSAPYWKEYKMQIIPDNAEMALELDVTADPDKSAVLIAAGGEENLEYMTRLTLHGSINSYDILAFRNRMPNLHYLDLTDVEIVANPFEYFTGSHTEDHRLGANSFNGMKKLVEVSLPKHITEIGGTAFLGCSNLKKVVLHEGIETIADNAFNGCTSLVSINLPNGIKSIGNGAFWNCTSLREMHFPQGLLSVEGNVCRDAKNLVTVTFPDCTEYIGGESFSGCSNLKNVTLPKKLISIQTSTFTGCESLEEIVLPSNVRSIEYQAFGLCRKLSEVRLPPMLEQIADDAFWECDNIKDVYTYVVVPKDIHITQQTFSETCYRKAMLHVPNFSRYSYMWNTEWSNFASATEFSDTYETFYAKNTLKLDNTTGGIGGTPDADVHETGGIVVSGDVKQELGEVSLSHDGEDGGSIIPENADNISIKHLNVKISVEANRWYFFCFPFDVPLDGVKYGGEYVWRQYDGEARSRHQGGWKDLAEGTTELQAGRGYIFQGTSSSVLHLNIHEPEIRYADTSTDLETYQGADTQAADANWNFVGNPYTSYYEVTEETYSAPITVWTGNGYEAYRPGDDDYEFTPYQAFFVQSGSGNSKVKFEAENRESKEDAEESMKARAARRAKMLVNPDRLLFNLVLYAQGEDKYIDKTRVVYNNKCSMDYEAECDAAKFFSADRAAEFYTIGQDGTMYSINERPEEDGQVSLGFMANKKGTYTISAQRMDAQMVLVDNVLGITHNLSVGEYEFTSDKGTFNQRFTLKKVVDEATSIDQLAQKIGMTYSISDGEITLDGLSDNTRVALYSADGQCITSQQGNGTLSAQQGVYVLSVGNLSVKVALK